MLYKTYVAVRVYVCVCANESSLHIAYTYIGNSVQPARMYVSPLLCIGVSVQHHTMFPGIGPYSVY